MVFLPLDVSRDMCSLIIDVSHYEDVEEDGADILKRQNHENHGTMELYS